MMGIMKNDPTPIQWFAIILISIVAAIGCVAMIGALALFTIYVLGFL